MQINYDFTQIRKRMRQPGGPAARANIPEHAPTRAIRRGDRRTARLATPR
jgi:hypothetical protein